MYIDGNEPVTVTAVVTAITIAIGIGVATHIVMNAIAGVPVWYGLGKAATTSAIMGAVSFGIGSVASSAAASYVGKAALQAGMHAVSGGIMSALETGNVGSGFMAAMVSSVIASGVQALGTNFTGTGAMQDANRNYMTYNKFGNSYMKAVMVVAGGLSGGISSSIAGGKFIDGFKQGLITAGLNHVTHLVADGINQRITRQQSLATIKKEYPRLYEVLSKLQDFLEANPKVLSNIVEDTGLTKVQVLEFLDVKSPNGPVYMLRKMSDLGEVGHLSVTNLQYDLVKTFETLQTPAYVQGTSFLLAVTALHEFVHWGRTYSGLPYRAPSNKWGISDYGSYWEQRTFGMVTGINKATINLSYQYGWKF